MSTGFEMLTLDLRGIVILDVASFPRRWTAVEDTLLTRVERWRLVP